MKRVLTAVLCMLVLLSALPALAIAPGSCVVDVPVPGPKDIDQTDLLWLKKAFPKLRSAEAEQTPFVFASAPACTKTRAVLNKSGEALTLYRFESEKALAKCKAMIQGNALVYGKTTVYADNPHPATYFYNDEERTIALYCGADKAVADKLRKSGGYSVAGVYGGYFDDRHSIMRDGIDIIIPRTGMPENLKELKARADSVYVVKVNAASTWKGTDVTQPHELEVTKNVRGIERKFFRIYGEWPEIMRPGRSYVVLVKHAASEYGATKIGLADVEAKSVFELNDKGYVLPIREYGMKKAMTLAEFLKKV